MVAGVRIRFLLVLVAGLVFVSAAGPSAQHPELNAFPRAQEGMERFVIVLPDKDPGDEDYLQVELIPGKTMLTDGVNLVRLKTTIEAACWRAGDTPTTRLPGAM